jgi:hypothetical protein
MRLVICALLVAACGNSNSVDSNEQARRAYLGLDKSVSKSLTLAFQGYDAASSANIPPETGTGDASGMLTITGQVSHGNPSQATMTLAVGMTDYSDGPIKINDKNDTISVTYATATDTTAQPVLNLKLNASAGSSITGSLVGDYTMTGDLKGTITLNLMISGTFTGTGTTVARVPGSTTVMGTATNSDGGVYQVNLTI